MILVVTVTVRGPHPTYYQQLLVSKHVFFPTQCLGHDAVLRQDASMKHLDQGWIYKVLETQKTCWRSRNSIHPFKQQHFFLPKS